MTVLVGDLWLGLGFLVVGFLEFRPKPLTLVESGNSGFQGNGLVVRDLRVLWTRFRDVESWSWFRVWGF